MKNHPFELQLSVSSEELSATLTAFENIAWLDFWLNPRRLRGSDFLMRWSQGVWSENRLVEAVNQTTTFFAIPYGPSGTAPTDDVRAFELYFEKLKAAGLGKIKRPDLLIFETGQRHKVDDCVARCGGLAELPFIRESDPRLLELLSLALLAVECENSLWRAEKMPDFHTTLRPQKRLQGGLGLKKNAVLPTVIIKEEDRGPLLEWQKLNRVPIHVWHVFFDRAYGLALDEAERLVTTGTTEPTVQTFQAPGGATTRKVIYKHYYHHAYQLGESVEEPELRPAFIEDKNGHILPYVRFAGGKLVIHQRTRELLQKLASERRANP